MNGPPCSAAPSVDCWVSKPQSLPELSLIPALGAFGAMPLGHRLGRRRIPAPRFLALGGDASDEDVGERLRDVGTRYPAARLQPQVRVVVHTEPRERGEARVDVAEDSRIDAGLQDRLDPSL